MSTASTSFPKIAVVHGADTELGQHLVGELVHSPEIEIVHALAPSECAFLQTLAVSYPRKLSVHISALDKLERVFANIPECDLAFCCLSTSKHAYDSIGARRFHEINFEIPNRFVHKAFDRGVLHVSLLSHAKADSSSRTEFYKLRGDLEKSVKALRREAGDFSPYISIFKVQSVSSDPNGATGGGLSRSSSRDRLSQKVSSKVGADGRPSIHVLDLAMAMRVDSFSKAAKQLENLDSEYRRGGHKFTEVDTADIVRLAREARAAAREERSSGGTVHRY